ncbi:FAD-binding monooxygenase [Arthrobacter sp. ERGS1:01]|uniref:FAD-dependent oxidoreductase n=1 Tax=Arthrobacter sp. ERGS1:01 TaxID=1704044 RepID=UPI0006B5AA82|nr:NAD(P)/FAD-dependent oxidoreductase [Arthrobacter sp. ERGS1:01]ALE05260.1 FAD-binding monooxygenase [Arthrobacter sp. ERGS1:01]
MHEVVIVGAGPVGLFLGALLLGEGVDVRILEQRSERSDHSRAIGIHPPALAALELVGVAGALMAEGVQIGRGLARSGGVPVAELSFAHVLPYPFVLTIPQARTEELLEERVRALDPAALLRGAAVTGLHDAGTHITVTGSAGAFQARLLIGADGARSTVRRLLGIPTRGRDYPDTYLMGDFPDTGSDGSTAVLYLEPGGIVESFPLPGSLRRWVVHTDSLLSGASAAELAGLILDRTGVSVPAEENRMLSAFGVRSRMALRMVAGRAALLGDAAHEISPIGGQGMNLGWLDAAALAPIIVAALRGEPTGARLERFGQSRMLASRVATGQAWLNMALGRPQPASALNLRHAILRPIFRRKWPGDVVAGRFSMQPFR